MDEKTYQKTKESRPPLDSIYIGNLTYGMDKDKIINMLKSHGRVRYVKLVVDPKTLKSKGIAFAQMGNTQENLETVEALNGTIYNGRTLKCSIANRLSRPFNPEGYNKGKKLSTDKSNDDTPDGPDTPVKVRTAPKVANRRRDKKKGLSTLLSYLKK